MEVWRIVLIVVFGWLLCGALSIVIPQCSSRLRKKLIRVSQRDIEWATDRYARLRDYSRLQARHLIGVDRMSDSDHLYRIYAMLLISGLSAYVILWTIHRKPLPERSPSGKP